MKKFCFIITTLLLFASCKETPKKETTTIASNKEIAQTPNTWNHLSLYHTKGKVKKIVQSTYLAKKKGAAFEKIQLGTRYETIWNEDALLLEKSYFNSSLKRQTKTNYLLKNKQWVSSKMTTDAGKLIKNCTYSYNDKGWLLQENQLTPQNQLEVTLKHTWSPKQELISSATWNKDGKLGMKCTYTLNEKGLPVQTVYEYAKKNAKIICKTQYQQFDEQGNWLKALETTSKGSIFIHERLIEYFPKR